MKSYTKVQQNSEGALFRFYFIEKYIIRGLMEGSLREVTCN